MSAPAPKQAPSQRRTSKIVKIRARPFNGKLAMGDSQQQLDEQAKPKDNDSHKDKEELKQTRASAELPSANSNPKPDTFAASQAHNSTFASTLASSPMLKITTLKSPVAPTSDELLRTDSSPAGRSQPRRGKQVQADADPALQEVSQIDFSPSSALRDGNATSGEPQQQRVDFKLATSKTQGKFNCYATSSARALRR